MLNKIKKRVKKILPKQSVKVSLFIVGAQKAGTSALHNYLIKHPKVQGGIKKEINFFNHKEKYEQGEVWYHKQFKSPLFYKPKSVYLDSTPAYLNNLDIPDKIYNYNKKAKIVILLREPVSRAYSAWNMYKQFSEMGKEEKIKLIARHISKEQHDNFQSLINKKPFYTFDEYVDNEIKERVLKDFYPFIVKRGIYVNQVKPYIDLFGDNNVLIVESNYFKNNKPEVTNKVLENLGLKALDLTTDNLKPVHSRKYESSISEATKLKLQEFYEPYNRQLFNLINKQFDW